MIIGVNASKWRWIQILRTPKHSERKHRSIEVSKQRFLLWHWTATQFNLQNTKYDLWRHQSDLHGHCGPLHPQDLWSKWSDSALHSITTWTSCSHFSVCSLNQSCYVSWISVKGHKMLRSDKSQQCSPSSQVAPFYINFYLHITALLPIETLYINIYLYIHLSLKKPIVMCNLFGRVKYKQTRGCRGKYR